MLNVKGACTDGCDEIKLVALTNQLYEKLPIFAIDDESIGPIVNVG